MRIPDDHPTGQPAGTFENQGSDEGGEQRTGGSAGAGIDADYVVEGEAIVDESGADEGTGGLQEELEAQRDRYLRLAAEYDNFRRRTQRERQELAPRAKAELVQTLLEALDDLDRFTHVDPSTTDAATVIEGVDMVERKFMRALQAAGLEVIDPLDQQFDPATQEAMTTTPAATPEQDHTVAQVFQLGYVFAGQLLRPARVVVRQWQE